MLGIYTNIEWIRSICNKDKKGILVMNGKIEKIAKQSLKPLVNGFEVIESFALLKFIKAIFIHYKKASI